MSNMRAKFQIQTVTKFAGGETLKLSAVGKSGNYPSDGSDEDNTFAKFTPSASCEICITNPALLGQFEPGQKYYVDFTAAPQ